MLEVSVKSMNVNEAKKISIDLNGMDSSMTGNLPVQTATEGKVYHQAYELTRDCTVPKEMERTGVYTKKENGITAGNEKHKEKPQTCMDYLVCGDDLEVLVQETDLLDEYTSTQFDRAISRIKKQRAQTQESVDRRVQRDRKQKDEFQRSAVKSAVKGTAAETYMEHLSQAQLPTTVENAERLDAAMQKSGSVYSLSLGSTKEIIRSGNKITPEVLERYQSVPEQTLTSGEGFIEIQSQVSALLDSAGLSTEESMEAAKWLYENQLPITIEHIMTYQQLNELKNLEPDVLLERIVDGMIDGNAPEHVDLTIFSRQEAGEITENIRNISEEELKTNYPEPLQWVTAQRQMEEIRLKMTIDAARQLANQGIQLDVRHLQEIVEGLREQEQQLYDEYLKEAELPITELNRSILSNTVGAAKQILTAPFEWLGQSLQGGMTQTLTTAAESAGNLSEAYASVQMDYETVGTQVRGDLGDSIQKAFRNVDSLLEELGLPLTEANQRAVRILGYGHMEVTTENINRAADYDGRVNRLMQKLSPENVLQMIREQVNPMEKTLTELEQTLDSFGNLQAADEASYSKFLWKLDKSNGITPEERKSFIGIYRLLDKVEKSNGVALGSVLNQGREVTLNSLLGAVRTKKAGNLDVKLDEEFGSISEIRQGGISISEQIASAFTNEVHAVKRNLSPSALTAIKDDVWDMPLEQIEEFCLGETEENRAYYESVAEQIRQLKESSTDAVQFLRRLDMPDSLENLQMAKAFFDSGNSKRRFVYTEEETAEIIENFDEPEDALEVFDRIDTEHQSMCEQEKKITDSYDSLQILRTMSQNVYFTRKLRKQEIYEIPMMTERGVFTVTVTIREKIDEKEKGTVQISTELEQGGKIEATFRLSGGKVSSFVTASEKEDLSVARVLLERVGEALSESGFEVQGVDFVQGTREPLKEVTALEKRSEWKQLYQVAKTFLRCVQNGGFYEN